MSPRTCGPKAAAMDTPSAWTCAIMMMARSFEMDWPKPICVSAPQSAYFSGVFGSGKKPWPLAYAVPTIMAHPNIAWRPFQRSALTDGPKPYLATERTRRITQQASERERERERERELRSDAAASAAGRGFV